MKKYVFVFLTVLFAACIQDDPVLKPPVLTISPDTTAYISVIKPVEFKIEGYANEDLVDFEISTSPFIDEFDTLFPSFTHNLSKEFKFNLTATNMPELGSDSIITVTFRLSDSYNTTIVERYLKVYNGYPEYIVASSSMWYKADSSFFYSFDYFNEFTFTQIQDYSFDLVALYDDDLGFILASPDAFYISQKLNELAYIYSSSNRRRTQLSRITTPYENITSKFLYELSVSEQYIDENGQNGVGVENLQVGDVLVFNHNDGRKGAIHITETDSLARKLSFDFKLQDL